MGATTLAEQAERATTEILAGMTPDELLDEYASAVRWGAIARSGKDAAAARAERAVLRAEILARMDPPF